MSNKERIKNQLYGLLCEREKGGEWKRFLDTILIELIGCANQFKRPDYDSLYSKLSALRYLSFEYYRKTIFECMNLIDRIEIV